LQGVEQHPTSARALDMSDRQVQHLVRLVEDLLDVSRLGRGKLGLRKEVVDLTDIVQRAAQTCRPLVDARRHPFSPEVTADALYLEADPLRLEQVLVNLLQNAVKYTDPGGRIELSARRAGREAVVRVQDSGIGIPPEMLTRIFD